MKKKNLIILSAIIIVLSFFFGWHYSECPLTFRNDLKASEVIALLLNFGVIAILIERFTDQIVLKPSYLIFIESLKFDSTTIMANNNTASVNKTEHKEKFYWISFAIGVFIASIGFRYFNNIIDTTTLVKCTSSLSQTGMFAIADIFLSGILMAGGAALILEIIEWINNEKK